jgi:hypothetical protein
MRKERGELVEIGKTGKSGADIDIWKSKAVAGLRSAFRGPDASEKSATTRNLYS